MFLLSAGLSLNAAITPFSFTLDEPCKTSAGVYQTNGTLVRTLWSNVRFYAAGSYTSNWDGLDDKGNAVAPNNYQIRLLEHNTEYVWDGAIGNTSTEKAGPTVHKSISFIQDLAISGSNAFYCSGYNEAQYAWHAFLTTDPQHVTFSWCWAYNQFGALVNNSGSTFSRGWTFSAADSNWVYFGCPVSVNPTNFLNNFPGCIVACKVADQSPASFLNGVAITNGSGFFAGPMPNGIYAGTQPGLSGLSVQMNGNLLAASVAPDNKVYIIDKQSGSTLNSFSINNPGRLNFSPDGSLWVTTSNLVFCYTNLNVSPTIAQVISGLSKPLAVAINPVDSNLILVADGGSSQQIKAFNAGGKSLWTYGLAGGYQTNGPAVTTNKFCFCEFNGSGLVDAAFLSFAPDGTYWVGDPGDNRMMHFSASQNYIEQVMYQPCSYKTYVDQNHPSRVFNQFLEFNVDYTKPLANAWTLVNNWMANVSSNNLPWNAGLYEVTTMTNGRTYAFVENTNFVYYPGELCELDTNKGLRFTGLLPFYIASNGSTNNWISLDSAGSVWRIPNNWPNWYKATLSGFDSNNNPLWTSDPLVATAANGSNNPVPRCCSFGNVRGTVSSNNILVSFDQSLNNGFHLGGIKLGTTNWLWQASPAVNTMDGTGNYEIGNGVQYAGDTLQALDRHIIFGYHGEFFRGQGQAGQHMHYYDDGLFVGQFGESSVGHQAWEGAVPGFAGNAHCPNLLKTATGDYYVWDNDESAHGPQRWHLVNARNIREATGTGPYGNAISLANPAVAFPTGIEGQPGNQSALLSWRPVANAVSYKIYESLLNGGPFLTNIAATTATNCLISSLTNGTTYYFVITAITSGTESIPSEQVAISPFDSSQSVIAVGSLTEGGGSTPVIDVDSNAPALGLAAYIGNIHLTGIFGLDDLCNLGFGNLMKQTVGTKGYEIFDWGNNGGNLTNVLAPFVVSNVSNWQSLANVGRQFEVNGVLGTNECLCASATGTINISVTDTNFHFLTVVSPDIFNNARNSSLTLTSVANGSSATYTINENPGWSHIFQFLFKGNVILSACATNSGGCGALIQGLFFDEVPVGFLPPPVPPTGFSVKKP